MAIGRLVKSFFDKTMAMLISQMVVLDRRIGSNSRRSLETSRRRTATSTVVAMIFGLGHDLDLEHNHLLRWSTLSRRLVLVAISEGLKLFLVSSVSAVMALLKSSTSSAPPPSLLALLA